MAINKSFVVRHGLEVATDLILANATNRRVGIGSTIPTFTLDVRGGIGATNTYTSGISTIINELRVGTGGTVFSVIAGPVGSGQSVGVGSASPAYLLDVRSPVSTGQTALYVYGDARITGDLVVDDLVFDDATVQDLRVQETLFVGADGGAGIATIKQLNVSGLTTTNQLIAYGISTFRAYGQFIDNTSLYFGNGADLNIYHDGSNSYIQEQGAGNLYVQSNGGSVNIRTNATENAFVANQDGSVELYYDNAKKFETLSIGATVTGTTFTNQLNVSGVSTFSGNVSFGSSALFGYNKIIFGSGNSLEIGHSGGGAQIYNFGGGKLALQSSDEIEFRTLTGFYARFTESFGALLYDNNNQIRLQTLGAGATVTGTLFTNQLSSSGVATANAYYVGGTQVISSARQLQNIASLDATTTATIEAAIQNAPNTFTDLRVTGVSTFVGLATFNSGLQVVSGVTTLGTVQVSSGIITATSGIITYYGNGSFLTGNARNLTATIGLGTTGGVVGYGVSFIQFAGPGVSTVYYNGNTGIATVTITGGGSGSASIGIGTTPGEAFTGIVTAGNLWYNSNLGRMFIYYQDVDSAQWVDASPSNVGVITSLTNVSFAPGSATSPSMYFIGDPQTGFFSPGAGQFTVVSTGSSVLNINPSGIRITGVATATDFDSLSDIRYKENINTVDGALSKVDQLRGVKFDWKESGLPSYGVIAQELKEVLPELVHGSDPKTVNYNGIIGVLIEAIKELKAEVEELKNNK